LRTMNAKTRLRMITEIETTAKNAAATLGCDVSMELRPGYPPISKSVLHLACLTRFFPKGLTQSNDGKPQLYK